MDDRHQKPSRIVLYSHDTLGFGHLRRNLLIAEALKAAHPRAAILLIGGMREAGAFELPQGVDRVTLPAYAKGADGSYRPRDLGHDLAPLASLHAQTIKATVSAFDPDLMIVDNVPRGAQFELDATLAALKGKGTAKLVLGLRDVIDRAPVVRRQWLSQRNFETVRRFYDAVWIYGDKALYDPSEDCGRERSFAGKARHVGYLDHSVRRGTPGAIADAEAILGGDERPYVFCSVGGGRDGADLCEAFSSAKMPEGHRGILVTGTQMAVPQREHITDLVARRDDMVLVPIAQDPIKIMARAARIVAMGGYNTTCEVLTLGVPGLIMPRVRPREEQLICARLLAEGGYAQMLHPDDLSPRALSAALSAPVASAVGAPLDVRGLDGICALSRDLLPADAGFAA